MHVRDLNTTERIGLPSCVCAKSKIGQFQAEKKDPIFARSSMQSKNRSGETAVGFTVY